MRGILLRSTESRIHIAVWGSTAPSERYSAMPSMNQRGSWTAEGTFPLLSGPAPPVMSNWKACTSSWPSTWSVSAIGPAMGSTTRRFISSVTPPVPSPMKPDRTLVCSKWVWLAYRMMGWRCPN